MRFAPLFVSLFTFSALAADDNAAKITDLSAGIAIQSAQEIDRYVEAVGATLDIRRYCQVDLSLRLESARDSENLYYGRRGPLVGVSDPIPNGVVIFDRDAYERVAMQLCILRTKAELTGR